MFPKPSATVTWLNVRSHRTLLIYFELKRTSLALTHRLNHVRVVTLSSHGDSVPQRTAAHIDLEKASGDSENSGESRILGPGCEQPQCLRMPRTLTETSVSWPGVVNVVKVKLPCHGHGP